MFCPNCKAEYRPGFTECSDCHVALVEELPEEPEEFDEEPDYVTFVPVLSTFNFADIAFIKSLLDDVQIIYFFRDENLHLVRHGMQPAVLMVQTEQAEETRELLKDLKLHFMIISNDKPGQFDD